MRLLLIYIFLDVRAPDADSLCIRMGFFFFRFFSLFFWKKTNSLREIPDGFELSEQRTWEFPSGRN